eukprot:m.18987 g.18987  ORF g.18987 m.18987 type:complete len:286 (-) comp10878_c0_seq1:126-983(-)
MSKLHNGLALLVDASSMSEQASPSNDPGSPSRQPVVPQVDLTRPSLSLQARACESNVTDPVEISAEMRMAVGARYGAPSTPQTSASATDISAGLNPALLLQAQQAQAMQAIAMRSAWLQAMQIQALQQQVLTLRAQARDHAAEPSPKRAKATRSRSPSYAVEGSRGAPRLSSHAKTKQVCTSCSTSSTPQWRHIKMPVPLDDSTSTPPPSTSDDDQDIVDRGDVFITVCNACALRFRKKSCICGTCKFIPSSTYTGSDCSSCGGTLLQGHNSSRKPSATTYHPVA